MGNGEEFYYKLPGTPGGMRPGAHRSRSLGPGLTFAAHRRLFEQPDPRRLDLRASLRDIRREWLVRVNRQHSSVNVQAIIDVSASMHFGSERSKLEVVNDFLESLGYSTFRHGDAVSLMAFDASARDDLYTPPRSSRGAGIAMMETLARCKTTTSRQGSADGLSHCIDNLTTNCSLVFIVSDFHWSLDSLTAIINKLGPALVVPIVVWDPAEIQPPTSGRWLSVNDAESGQRKNLWLRKSIRKKWEENVAHRRKLLNEHFAAKDIKPFFAAGSFNAESMTKYFMDNVL
ncbi:MAG: hypothetical protein KTR32_04220 [Granulosicoccus sp.]|nr:hypothetical protein [Granulosicoccus sp.]